MGRERREQARRVLLESMARADLDRVLDPDTGPRVRRLMKAWTEALSAGHVDWLLEHTDPEIVIVQPPGLPGAKRYVGHDGFLEAILDWPANWDDFRMEWKRSFQRGDDQIVAITHHRGRGRETAIEVEADVVWVSTWRDDDKLLRWEMFIGPDAEAEAGLQAGGAGPSRSGDP
jgi:ketosteroid isomerase-like protein